MNDLTFTGAPWPLILRSHLAQQQHGALLLRLGGADARHVIAVGVGEDDLHPRVADDTLEIVPLAQAGGDEQIVVAPYQLPHISCPKTSDAPEMSFSVS